MKDGAKILRFPGPWPGSSDFDHDYAEFESWEVVEDFLRSENYAGLVEYCKREASGDPENLHAWELLGEAYNLNGQHLEAIEAMGEVHRRYPGIKSFQHLILDALFALEKTENDYDWVLAPWVRRIGSAVLDECYEFLRPKRTLREVSDLLLELISNGGYLTFSDEELLAALSRDGRFAIEEGPFPGLVGVRVRRKRDGGSTSVPE